MKAGFNKLIAHGLTGGVRSRLSGGSFKSGFLGSLSVMAPAGQVHMRRQVLVAKPTHGHKEYKMLSLLMWLAGLLLSWVAVSLLMAG
ncbi:hypothetical protein BSPWISOXPB_6549 [uncultured Gammaproteobacteria bacterium]|nr:hypothetical protein BSPWISOXPB_6549 [uncultured Gammaproteobacteria bacterium]